MKEDLDMCPPVNTEIVSFHGNGQDFPRYRIIYIVVGHKWFNALKRNVPLVKVLRKKRMT